MPRESYKQHLRELQDGLLVLASMVDKAIDRSVRALRERDLEIARQVIADDSRIDRKCLETEERCVQLIVTQQPVAGDLRFILSIIHLLDEMERMGDHAEGIARIAVMIGDEPPLKPLIDIPRMADKTRDMFRRSLEAFANRDADAAMQISAEDDVVDGLYDQVYRELLTFMHRGSEDNHEGNSPHLGGAQPRAVRGQGDEYLRAYGLHSHGQDRRDAHVELLRFGASPHGVLFYGKGWR